MSHNVWGDLPEQRWLAVVVDKGVGDEPPRLEVVGFSDEDDAYNFCNNYDSVCYDWVVITGCVCSSGSVSDGRLNYY